MIQFVAFVAVSLAVAVVLRRRVAVAAAVAIALFVGIPVVAAVTVIGPVGTNVHPASVFVFVVAGVQLLTRTGDYSADLRKNPLAVLLLGSFVAVALIAANWSREGSGSFVPLNQVLAPILLFVLMRRALADLPHSAKILTRTILVLAGLESLVAIGVANDVIEQPWRQQLSGYRFYHGDFERSFGTTDHPLVLAAFLAIAVCLVPVVRSAVVQMLLVVLFTLGIVTTESRTALLVAVVAVVSAAFRTGVSARARWATCAALGAATLVFFVSPLSSNLLEKFGDDGGSAGARSDAIPTFLAAIPGRIIVGDGPGTSYRVSSASHLGTSLENGVLMYALDYGALFALMYFGVMVAIVVRPGARAVVGGRLAAVAAFVAVASFSSVAVNSSIGAFLWIALAFGSVSSESAGVWRKADRHDPAGVDGIARSRTLKVVS